ncbi:hypothetical protein [Dermatobacter hominis]|uniref:hypothetical protein n=1 Tax=Dermatobacter hominis TaxID=2884263 RepID=UPI001D12E492|nr:hypothetical protein [Dermatobacter hominis]UDY37016.1 hypothetical protein LH044_05630 [Dermatobacter hominis]
MTEPDPTDPTSDPPAPAADQPVRPRALHRAAVRGAEEPERAWTPLGTLDSGVLAHVDEAGSVQLLGSRWSLDWWVGAEDRWHHPSREASVRQRTVGDAPVVETALRVPGGDVVARAYGVQAHAGDWRGPAVVVEVENRTAVPVALAVVLRPLSLDGEGHLRSVRSEGPTVEVDGARLLLAREPARVVAGALDQAAPRLAAGDDSSGPLQAERSGGDLEAAVVLPLTHTAIARVLLPVTTADRRDAPVPTGPWEAPDAEAVAKGWSVHGGDELRIVVPEDAWDDAVAWAGALLRLAGPDEVGAALDRRRVAPFGPCAAVRTAEVTEAMARLGASDALVPVARGLADAQRLGGDVRLGDRTDGTVALLHAIAGVLAETTDPEGPAAEELVAPAAVAVRRLRKGKALADGGHEGLTGSAVRALRSIAPALVGVGQPEVAEDALAVAAQLAPDDQPSRVRRVDETTVGVRSPLEVALSARALVLGRAGGDAVAAVRACWAGAVGRGRSDAESRRTEDGPSVPIGVLGFDVAELAARTNALLDVLVTAGGSGPALLPSFDPGWAGQPVEAHAVRTPWGATSFAVRWHGARPAVLWEIEPADGEDVTVTAPGPDPAWRGSGRVGEALLAEPAGVLAAHADEPAHDQEHGHDHAPGAGGGPGGAADSGGAGGGLPGEGESFG